MLERARMVAKLTVELCQRRSVEVLPCNSKLVVIAFLTASLWSVM